MRTADIVFENSLSVVFPDGQSLAERAFLSVSPESRENVRGPGELVALRAVERGEAAALHARTLLALKTAARLDAPDDLSKLLEWIALKSPLSKRRQQAAPQRLKLVKKGNVVAVGCTGNVVAVGCGLVAAVALTPAFITLHVAGANESHSNLEAVRVQLCRGQSTFSPLQISLLLGEDAVLLVYMVEAAGEYDLSLLSGQNLVKELSISVSANETDVKKSRVVGLDNSSGSRGCLLLTAGLDAGFTVQTFDSRGFHRPCGGDVLHLQCLPGHIKETYLPGRKPDCSKGLSWQDNNNGSYSCQVSQFRRTGRFVIVVWSRPGRLGDLSSDWTILETVPVLVQSAALDFSKSCVLSGQQVYTSGDEAVFTIVLRDGFGNVLTGAASHTSIGSLSVRLNEKVVESISAIEFEVDSIKSVPAQRKPVPAQKSPIRRMRLSDSPGSPKPKVSTGSTVWKSTSKECGRANWPLEGSCRPRPSPRSPSRSKSVGRPGSHRGLPSTPHSVRGTAALSHTFEHVLDENVAFVGLAAMRCERSGKNSLVVGLKGHDTALLIESFECLSMQAIDASQCTLHGSVSRTQVASETPLVFTIVLKDKYDNPIDQAHDIRELSLSVRDVHQREVMKDCSLRLINHAEECEVSVGCMRTGTYSIDCKVARSSVAGLPLTLTVIPQRCDIEQCDVIFDECVQNCLQVLPPTRAQICGRALKVEIVMRDSFGNVTKDDSMGFELSFFELVQSNSKELEQFVPFQPLDNGTHAASCSAESAGEFVLHVVASDASRNIFRRPLRCSPLVCRPITFEAGRPDPRLFTAEGTGLSSCHIDEISSFTVTARDRLGNEAQGNTLIQASLSGPSRVPAIRAIEEAPGKWACSYTARVAGSYRLHINIACVSGSDAAKNHRWPTGAYEVFCSRVKHNASAGIRKRPSLDPILNKR